LKKDAARNRLSMVMDARSSIRIGTDIRKL